MNYNGVPRRKLSVWTKGILANPYASHGFADYDDWIRSESARSFFGRLLNNPDAIYSAYLPAETVKLDWESHFAGKNAAQALCRYATFEIWLQQGFEKKMRPFLFVRSHDSRNR